MVGTDPARVAARPDTSRSPGEWIARYVSRRIRETGAAGLDSLVATHLHQDHIGGVGGETPLAPDGQYRLTGVSDVAHRVRVARLLDPDSPIYGDIFEGREQAENYLAFARAKAASGQAIERLRVGAAAQILASETAFSVRTVAARGRVWTGSGVAVRDVFARSASLPQSERPNENARSAALIVDYGSFRFFIGGDLTDWATAGTKPWLNALTPTVRPLGRSMSPCSRTTECTTPARSRLFAPLPLRCGRSRRGMPRTQASKRSSGCLVSRCCQRAAMSTRPTFILRLTWSWHD